MSDDYAQGVRDGASMTDAQSELMTLGELFSPFDDDRLRPCPECGGEGSLGEGDCGVCLGDGYVWKTVPPATHVTRFVDHSGVGHDCWRCTPRPPTT